MYEFKRNHVPKTNFNDRHFNWILCIQGISFRLKGWLKNVENINLNLFECFYKGFNWHIKWPQPARIDNDRYVDRKNPTKHRVSTIDDDLFRIVNN